MPSVIISNPVNVTGTSLTSATNILTTSIPGAGLWEVTYFVKMLGNPGYAALYASNTGAAYTATEISGTRGTGITESSAIGNYTISTSGPLSISLKGWGTYQAVSNSTGRTGIMVNQLTGGTSGQKGAKGDTGLTGPTGPAGPVGATGKTGATGNTGAAGLQGIKGDAGPQGARGDTGAQGPGRPVTIASRPPTSTDGAVGDIWYQVS